MEKSTNVYRFKHFPVLLLLFCVLSLVFFISCDDENASSNENNEYGSVAVSIRVFNESAPHSDESLNRHAMAVDPSCQVRVEIMDSSRNVIASGGPWDWSDGSGTVTGVPVGSDRIIRVEINDPADSVLQYRGEMSSVTISAGANDLTDSPIVAYAIDFSGYWYVTQNSTSNDAYCGQETLYNYATISQDGFDVGFNVDGYLGSTEGYVEGDTLYLEDVYFTNADEVTIYSNWSFVLVSADSITGSASWTYEYLGTQLCTGTSTFSGTRQ